MPKVSPWANKAIAPMHAAGAIVPLAAARGSRKESLTFSNQLHGTGFFISRTGMFLTAEHVLDPFPNENPPLSIIIVTGRGMIAMRVALITRHPTLDVGLGFAVVPDDQIVKPCPLTLSETRLAPDADVAILGYPRTRTEYREADDGDMLCSFTFTPDYFEGEVLEHHPEGVSLAKGAAYSTNIVPPPPLRDFSGISGGPLVAPDSIDVHGIVCSACEDYAICTDIAPVLDWPVFDHDEAGPMCLRQMSVRYPGLISIRASGCP